jgi:hypothetical protein
VFAALIVMAVVSTALAMPLARLMLGLANRRQPGVQPAALAGRQVETS